MRLAKKMPVGIGNQKEKLNTSTPPLSLPSIMALKQ